MILLKYKNHKPIALETIVSFYKEYNDTHTNEHYDIIFECGYKYRWDFETEEERNNVYDKIMKLYDIKNLSE